MVAMHVPMGGGRGAHVATTADMLIEAVVAPLRFLHLAILHSLESKSIDKSPLGTLLLMGGGGVLRRC